MLKRLLLLSLFSSFSYCLLAQSEILTSEPKPETERHKWEVALNVWPVIRDIKAGEAGLMVRKHFKDENENKKAYRFTINNFNHLFESTEGWSVKRSHFNSMNTAFGKEWQKQTGKFMLYYGADIGLGIIWNRDVNLGGGNPEDSIEYKYGRSSFLNIFGSAGGLLGAKYFVNSNLSLSLESNLFYRLSEYKRYDKYYDINKKLLLKDVHGFGTVHQFVFQSISAFYLSYYFN